jgi:hypothetical protein
MKDELELTTNLEEARENDRLANEEEEKNIERERESQRVEEITK